MVNLVAILIAFLSIFSASPAWTHGGNQHVMGTVTAIDVHHLELKTPKGETVSVQLTDKTEYVSKNTPPANGRPRVGDRVVIDVVKEGNSLRALEMEFSTPGTNTKPSR